MGLGSARRTALVTGAAGSRARHRRWDLVDSLFAVRNVDEFDAPVNLGNPRETRVIEFAA